MIQLERGLIEKKSSTCVIFDFLSLTDTFAIAIMNHSASGGNIHFRYAVFLYSEKRLILSNSCRIFQTSKAYLASTLKKEGREYVLVTAGVPGSYRTGSYHILDTYEIANRFFA